MDPVIKEQWVTALRSGQYAQGYMALSDGYTRFCCLGVLCEIHPDVERVSYGQASGYVYNGQEQVVTLSHTLSDAIGLDRLFLVELIGMNDDNCFPFHAIADWIEEHL